jgi:hypothetical protein
LFFCRFYYFQVEKLVEEKKGKNLRGYYSRCKSCIEEEEEEEGGKCYLHIARISHSGTPTIRPLLYRRERKRKWLIHRCRRCLIATLSRKRKRDQIIIRREPKKHTAARGIYIGTNGLEKMLDDI